jgi:hypothetical protein
MAEGGGGAGFLLEAAEAVGMGGKLARQHLDGDVASQARVVPLIHFAHAADAEEADDLVRSDARAWFKSHPPEKRIQR